MNNTFFITGGTGFLGTEIVLRLIRTTQDPIYVLVRAGSESEGTHRLRSAWQHSDELCSAIGSQVLPVTGDFTKKDLGISSQNRQLLRENVTKIFHCGAEIGFQKDEKELMLVNCKGTENVLNFAYGCSRLQRFIHISTAYVAGQRSGVITEKPPESDGQMNTQTACAETGCGKNNRAKKKHVEAGANFSSLYEKSKALAEDLVRISGLPFSICRPGMIVGDSTTGRAKNFNTIYYVLKLFLLGKMPILPISPDTGLNLVPVDYVADAVVRIGADDDAEGKIFHLTCPSSMQPTAGQLAEYVRHWAKDNLSVDISKPAFLPLNILKKAGLSHNTKKNDRRKNAVSNLMTLLPYFFSNQEFDRTNTDAVAGRYDLEWQQYIDALLDFACRSNFMRQDGKTVFEQAQIRRASRRYPVSYYDVSADGITKYSGKEVNRKVLCIAGAMLAHGIRKGDRVALAGINSVDYMALDQAIGLIGAVSVPIYYTTPAAELDLLISRSGAQWFFAGDTRIMSQLGDLPSKINVVSFSIADNCGDSSWENSSGSAKGGTDVFYEAKTTHPDVIRWSEFLSGAVIPDNIDAPDPDDLATIRFTSGTTGEPKGVTFTFSQLAWMGSVMTALLPWKDRNRAMRYLSFLPQSHVVEGILASYAPYYMLAKADYYYLNDFDSLTSALPKVRPNVFFSVPRFYEKLWEQIMASNAGKRWFRTKKGPAKKALGAVIRHQALKKAGLDRCDQLIVGSAPVSEALLRDFRELGIEIYNAYGQTEAPLITINRLGDNQIPTVGTPLPETEVTMAQDGQLIVRGPQVTRGYYQLDTDSIQEGALMTGDLGTILENGHIELHGRKKEIIVTAYGKNISIPRIEEQLKNIPEIAEAVLIGDHRPYCTALLWLESDAAGSMEAEAVSSEIAKRIRQINKGLSHPEQIRNFRIIEQPLSIQSGELTPNLKVKRAVVASHFKDVIQEMYES